MLTTALSRASLAALLVGVAGCNVFDESLVPKEDATGVRLGEDCLGDDLPELVSKNSFVPVDTTDLNNDRHQLSCVGQSALGNDGFFVVQMTKDEKWHFHVKVMPGTTADPTVYVLDSGCQDSVCQRGWGLNECLPGQDEHFSFFPPRTGKYFVAVDTIAPGGEPMELLAVRPECGNDVKEHSETCEDGNTESGDGCDSLCREELAFGAREVEPNDEPTANANVLVLDGDRARTAGTVGGACDFDSFAVTVPERMPEPGLDARVTGACSYDLSLQLIRPDGFTPLKNVETKAGECPEIAQAGLEPGVYYLRLTTQRQDEPTPLEYGLEVDITAP